MVAAGIALRAVTIHRPETKGAFHYAKISGNFSPNLNFLLMHSSTQGSGTAEHLNMFFFWSSLVFKDKCITGLSLTLDDVFPRFSLSSM